MVSEVAASAACSSIADATLIHTFAALRPTSHSSRLQQHGEAEVRAAQDALSDLDAQGAALELEIREKEDEVAGLQVGGGEEQRTRV